MLPPPALQPGPAQRPPDRQAGHVYGDGAGDGYRWRGGDEDGRGDGGDDDQDGDQDRQGGCGGPDDGGHGRDGGGGVSEG
ncbi:hypothetical protein V492_08161 [Pseudogymnoascus sp. VKM F-4246]|nr:hypothetical protein V492_08161 [Pseudogymnoascus sp. VKM F-4246]